MSDIDFAKEFDIKNKNFYDIDDDIRQSFRSWINLMCRDTIQTIKADSRNANLKSSYLVTSSDLNKKIRNTNDSTCSELATEIELRIRNLGLMGFKTKCFSEKKIKIIDENTQREKINCTVMIKTKRELLTPSEREIFTQKELEIKSKLPNFHFDFRRLEYQRWCSIEKLVQMFPVNLHIDLEPIVQTVGLILTDDSNIERNLIYGTKFDSGAVDYNHHQINYMCERVADAINNSIKNSNMGSTSHEIVYSADNITGNCKVYLQKC